MAISRELSNGFITYCTSSYTGLGVRSREEVREAIGVRIVVYVERITLNFCLLFFY